MMEKSPIHTLILRPALGLASGWADRTDIERRCGNVLVDAELKKEEFQCVLLRSLSRCRDLPEVFGGEWHPFGTMSHIRAN
jgi:hypothetical protein